MLGTGVKCLGGCPGDADEHRDRHDAHDRERHRGVAGLRWRKAGTPLEIASTQLCSRPRVWRPQSSASSDRYAETLTPSDLRAVLFGLDPVATDKLAEEWMSYGIPVPLELQESPYRDIGQSLASYIRQFRERIERMTDIDYASAPEQSFEFGLGVILDGFEKRLSGRDA